MSRPLDVLSFPLRGSQLVEASAGTGKTWTIGALYLRLVLGHGGEAGYARPLDPPEILVVTFTDAATKELRDRIRGRLTQAAQAFAQEGAAPDALLHALRAAWPPQQWPDCARRLRLAAEWMDEAAVSTIHGWCQRMLREHAFDSGSLFTQALQADAEGARLEATRDWWRSHVYALTPAQAARLAAWWPTPEALAKDLKNLLPLAGGLPDGPEPAPVLATVDAALAACKKPWREGWLDGLAQALQDACAAKRLNGNFGRWAPGWMARLREWADGLDRLPDLKAGWDHLSPEGMRAACKGSPAVDHPGLADLATLRERVASIPDGRPQVLAHATHWVARRMALDKARRAEIGFDDMLAQLARALQGEGGERLAARIRRQFPVALIDEFQDTDALQWGIFDRVWQAAADRQDLGLVLIGDPKQAIYSFRGADIHSYLAAKAATAPRHHSLGTNHRASTAMVAAVNTLFTAAEQRPGGAFLVGAGDARPVPFEPVAAAGRAEAFEVDGTAPPALVCWWAQGPDNGKPMGATAYRERMAQACAAEVVRLLALGRAQRAGFRRDGVLQPLHPGDIAVLVNKRSEADAVRGALRALGVRSVYLSDDESVYRQPVADCLRRLLQAVAEPDDEPLVRAALATPLLGQDWSTLDALQADPLAWEAVVLQFQQWRERWRRHGVLPMLRQLLAHFGVPHRLLAAGDERQLTDVLHLAELLQQASARLDGEQALVRFLAEQCAQPGSAGEDARVLRLESDADLLKVVTVHKSKGLEYPLVFLPFACAFRAVAADDLSVAWHDAEGRLQVALQATAAQVAQADDERLAEDLRKLYVALTRARHATWVGLAPVADLHRSAAGHLLAGPEAMPAAAWPDWLDALAVRQRAIARHEPPTPTAERWRDAAPATAWADEPPLPALRPRWSITSYSGLAIAQALPGAPAAAGAPVDAAGAPQAAGADVAAPEPASGTEATWAEEARIAQAEPAGGPVVRSGLHALPRGAAAGTFLHELLEWAGRTGYAVLASRPEDLAHGVAQRCRVRGWDRWAPVLTDWLQDWLSRPWPLARAGQGVADTAPVALATVQVELEFWLDAPRLDLAALDALVTRHTLGAAPRRPLLPGEVRGLLKGYVDLAFGHGGRWWVADWKSNALGDDDGAYTPQALQAEMLRHRYDLQVALYLFALHRQLRARLPGYDWDRDVGGAAWLFLRGQGGPCGGLHLERPPRALVEGLDRLFDGAGEGAA